MSHFHDYFHGLGFAHSSLLVVNSIHGAVRSSYNRKERKTRLGFCIKGKTWNRVAAEAVTELDRCTCKSKSKPYRFDANTVKLMAIQWFNRGYCKHLVLKSCVGELCCHIGPKPISEKQPIPKDNRGTESLPLRKDMTHTPLIKSQFTRSSPQVAPLQQNISHPQSQLVWVIATVICLTVLMGLVREAAMGGKERGASERRRQIWLRRHGPSWKAANNTPERRSQLLKNTLWDFKSPKSLWSKSQTCC